MRLKKTISRTSAAALIWLLVVAGAGLWSIVRIADAPVINADLLSLLPHATHEPDVQQAADRVHGVAERKLFFLVSAGEKAAAREAAALLVRELSDTGLFARLDLKRDQALLSGLGRFYFPFRFQLLSLQARGELSEGRFEDFERRLLSRYLSPLSGLNSDLIAADPLLLLPDFLSTLAPAGAAGLRLDDGYLTVEQPGVTHVLVWGDLAESPFSMAFQDRLTGALESLRDRLAEAYPEADFAMAGVFPHAAAGTAAARQEVSTVGIGSLIGVFLLFVLVFRSLRPFFLATLTIAVGCLGGFAACLLAFGQVHLLTLVFGASLVGISVDYALHYFCEHMAQGETASASRAVQRVFAGITFGLATSIVGFLGILVAPFPGLREMAVFSSAGLLSAWLCVVVLYPVIPQAVPRRSGAALELAVAYGRFWAQIDRRGIWLGAALLLVVSLIGCIRLVPLDDFRLLQARDPVVSAEEDRVRALLGQDYASQFYLVFAKDEAQLLEREEALIDDLVPLMQDGALSDYVALSRHVPSPRRQDENRRLLRALLAPDSSVFAALEAEIGLPESARTAFVEGLAESAGRPPLQLDSWLASPVSEPFRHHWAGDGRRAISVVTLAGVKDVQALEGIAQGHDGVSLVDRVGDLSAIFKSYRSQTFWLTAASYLVVTLLLIYRYGRKGAMSVIAVPAAAAFIAFGVLGYIGEPVSLFNVMALLLVLGIGVDYGIFFREAGGVKPSTLLAVAMSAATTILAFGLLAVSSTMAVHSFGLTLLIGITAAFLISPVSALAFPPASHNQAAGAGHDRS